MRRSRRSSAWPTHWAGTARPFLAEHCPKSRVEAFGGHMMFWEYPERFNALLAEFLSAT